MSSRRIAADVRARWFTVSQAAEYSGTSPITVRRLIERGELEATKFTPRALRVSRASLDALAERNSTATHRGGAR
ncbi:helix-turn-helix domain-containing protein [Dietzia timorensis]|uniref:Helix-turn-helix domain-containing protein n=1 Tax=Dietzia timorensis TaxID=499555 RepID=A0A173LIA0_9ACTN|nr:helix-turn-helix domain-containing protein [Dietzia timorensis]ANI91248.1 Hypothetical protein BJL86_0439 [Dietzia timorensis]